MAGMNQAGMTPAGMSPAGTIPAPRGQLRAIAHLRWRLTVNSLRSVRGQLNLLSRILGGLMILAVGGGGGTAMFFIGLWATAKDPRWLALPFWSVFLFWQVFPVLATAFSQNLDSSALLRFPMRYSAYFLVRVIYGTLDIATALGLFWLTGLFLGIVSTDLTLLPWAALAIGLFAVFNILLGRMIFAWIEHWLSRRRSREVLGFLFLMVMVGFQIFGSQIGRHAHNLDPQKLQTLARFLPVEQALPPGLAAYCVANAALGRGFTALLAWLMLAAFASMAAWLLHLRLYGQYRGENPAEGEKRRTTEEKTATRRGWKLPVFSSPVSAVFEKELRSLSRSGPMLFTMIMPLVVVFVLWGGKRGFLGQQNAYALPAGAAYCLLVMTNMVYNSFGGEGGGIQFYLFSPVPFRQIVMGKNLAHMSIVATEVFLLWLGVRVIYGSPPLTILALTVSWYLFAAPINFAAGDLLSLYSPKRIDYATFGRQRASSATVFVSLGVQLAMTGTGVGVIVLALHFATLWAAVLVFLVLSVPTIAGYLLLLSRIDGIAMKRREVLASELCRA
jgi:ABC-2 type transport system permease protein